MTDLRNDLALALGAAYRLERELGGGGMSHVFVATEVALGRQVVIKVLPPALAAGVSLERFRREVQVLAALQHPLIVPLLSAGEGRGLVWYVMPLVEGESLRAREQREGRLPPAEAVRILRDVAEALAYAHARGLVHRDIKPENILLTAGRAVVADFGVAKALSAAAETEAAGLTGMGLALGTPAYMSPEQAAADPETDHRADLYALGCIGYEMLAGRPPFTDLPPAQLLAAHVTTPPQGLEQYAPAAPPALSALVMRCLAKRPADRPESALAIVQALDAIGTPASGTAATGALGGVPLLETVSRDGWFRLLGVYAVVAGFACAAARWAMWHLGLPDWVFTSALAVSALGAVPLLLAGAGLLPRLTHRAATLGGLTALLLVPTAAGAHALLRAAGVGPMGSLQGAGKLRERDRLLIADFANSTADTVLTAVVTEAFRTDFTQSRSVSVVGPEAVRASLQRMQRPVTSRLDVALAREIAVRDGIKGVVDGDIAKVGSQYVLSARLVAAQDGEVLAAFRETADGDRELIGAIDRLSKQLREKIGESLQTIRAGGALEQVTTASLEALTKYTEAIRAGDSPDPEMRDREIALLKEAVALDSTFAMAWRRLGVRLGNGFVADPAAIVDAITRAYRLRDRLSPVERGLAEASYYSDVLVDPERALAAYEQVLALDPQNRIALNNAAIKVVSTGGSDSALIGYARRLMAVDPNNVNSYTWLTEANFRLGRTEEAHRAAQAFQSRFGVGPGTVITLAHWLSVDRQYDSAAALLRTALGDPAFGAIARSGVQSQLAGLARLRGQLADGRRYDDGWITQRAETDSSFRLIAPYLQLEQQVLDLAWIRQQPALARAVLDRGRRELPLERLTGARQRYDVAAFSLALVGDAPRAQQALEAYRRVGLTLPPDLRVRFAADSADNIASTAAWIAAAAGDAQRAVALMRPVVERRRQGWLGNLAALGLFYAAAHQPDSAVAVLRRFVDSREPDRAWVEPFYLPRVQQVLGAQYELLGKPQEAAEAYQQFLDLWRHADPELQPQVQRAKEALARLTAEPRKRG